MGKKKTASGGEKKARKTRAKMRTKKESVAGHFADRLTANAKQRADIMRAVSGFPGVDQVSTSDGVIAVLCDLADKGFKPERKKGGNRGPQFAVGQKVKLASEAVNMIKSQCPEVEVIETFVGVGYDGGKSVPVRGGGSALTDKWIGFVSKKFLTASA